ncbi:hypothetical protein Ddye_003955 [Dipteronia dyeriana]|uniref:Myb-like domain-containing protein n=1 Tax=Dipteronia dyeriana TaxID=168575 RepID=A0AAE0CVV7_9ROSI|nr:hypothetical protein Ddye_003955 [Dipteronia dyeriana]
MDDDDLFDEEPRPTVTRARPGLKFQPKVKPTLVPSTTLPDDGRRQACLQTSSGSDVERFVESSVDVGDVDKRLEDPAGLSSSVRASGENAGVNYGLECLDNFPNQSACKIAQNDTTQEDTCPDLFTTGDPGNCRESAVFNNDGGTPFDSGRLETQVQQGGDFLDTDTIELMSEAAIAPGGHAFKYKPKPRVRTEKANFSTDLPQPDAIESVMHPPDPQFVSSETACMPDGSIPFSDYVLDYSSIDLGDIISSDPTTSELPMNAELTNHSETSHADISTSGDVSRMAIKPPRKPKAVPELVDEPDDEAHDYGSYSTEPPVSSVGEDESNIDGLKVDSKTKKKAPRKSKKPVTENEKPVRKRKKAKEASDQSTREAPKKFPHSTRRKRRRVSKELLETPEDEIDPQKVPMKDLILLAEYRERLASKEAKTPTPPLTNESTENYFHEEDYYYNNEEQTYASEQVDYSVGDHATHGADPSTEQLYNYHSFMKKKTPTIRWSKQETEVFYEAIQKFGTDLSTIQQLFFPERSRHQVKLKYKKEEREHPLRLTDALTNRAKDHSHFEKAIEQLQQVSARAGQDTNGDDSNGMTAEVEDLATEINQDEVVKTEQAENGETADVAEEHSPPKAEESDDGVDYWDSYECNY